MSKKQTWLQKRASQLKPNAAGGDNTLPVITSSSIFADLGDDPTSTSLAIYERGGELVMLIVSRQGSDTRVTAAKSDGIILFDRLYSTILTFHTVAQRRGWLLFTRVDGGVDKVSVLSNGTGILVGEVSLKSVDFWESKDGRVVAMKPITGTVGLDYEFYELALNSSRVLTSTYLWTDPDKPEAYHPETDNLIFPLTGKCRELLTGTEVWNFSVTDFEDGLHAPHGALVDTAFDEDGNAYNIQLEQTRVGDVMEERPVLRKLTFPTKTGSPQSATESWSLDLSQSFPNTNNSYELWGADVGSTSVDILVGAGEDFVEFTNYVRPRSLCLTSDALWLVMPEMEFDFSWEPSPGVTADSYTSHPAVLEISPADGSIVRKHEFPALTPDAEGGNNNEDIYSDMLGADSTLGDWVLLNLWTLIGEGPNFDPLYQSVLVTIQGANVTGPTPLSWEDPMQDGAQAMTTTTLPHQELEDAIIGGGAIFYPHEEENDDRTVRKMGDGVFPDYLKRLCRNKPCKPKGSVNIAGIPQLGGPAGTEYSGLDAGSAAASMGGGWHMAPYKKILEGPDGQLEFVDGSSNYEKWTLDGGNYVPVHGNNYVKAVKNMDDTFTLTFPDQTKLEFDEYGLVVSEEDRSGNVTTYTYESVSAGDEKDARITSVSDGFGRETEFVYATSDLSDRQPIEVIQKEQGGTSHRTTTLEYDSVTDALVKVTAPNGDEMEYVYYPDGKIHKVIEPGERVAVTYTYYGDGRVETETSHISTEFPNGTMQRHYSYDDDKSETTITTKDMQTSEDDRVMTYTYDLLYNVVKEEDAIGNVTRYKYADTNDPYLRTEMVAPNLAVTKWSYNSLGNISQVEDAQGNITNFEYGEDIGPSGDQYKHQIRKVIRPAVSADSGARYTTEFKYDTLGRVNEIVDAFGNSSYIEYWDTTGQPKGLVKKTTDRRGNDTDFTYYSNGNLETVSVETGRSTGVITADFEYDGFDNVTKAISDKNGLDLEVQTVYDALNRATQVTDARGKVSSFSFDDGLLEYMDLPANTASSSSARRTTMVYDSAARVTQVKRDISSSTEEMRVKYAYDGFSQLQALTRIKNSSEKSFTFDYDLLGRQTASTDPLSKTHSMAYEPFCTGYTQTSARGIRTKASFDTLCRMTEIEVGDPGSDPLEVDDPRELRTFDYDELGRLIQVDQGQPPVFGTQQYGTAKYGTPLVGGDSGVRTMEYDKLDRLTKITFEDSTYTEFEYDDEGNVTKMTDPDGNVTDYVYWDDNKLRHAIIMRSSSEVGRFTYDYDAAGRPKSIVYPSSTGITAYFDDGSGGSGWNENGQLVHLRYHDGSSDIRTFEYSYDDSGNRTQAVEVVGMSSTTWDYEYDWLDRLSKVTKDSAVQSVYAYDASDNRISLDRQTAGDIFTYVYDDADNLTEVKKDSGGGAVTIETFTKDDDGNMLTRTDVTVSPNITTTYEWDDFNKLIKVSESDGTTTTTKHESLYGVNGFRRRKTDSNSVTTTEYAEGLSTALAKTGSATITYIRAHGIAGFESSSGFFYFLGDALGSIRSIVNASGTVQSSYDLDEYGNLISTPPTGVTSQKTFVGSASVQDETGDTGLYLMGHRWMDPRLGRFINRDPIGFDGGLNLFNYPLNPISYVDPAGLRFQVFGSASDAHALEYQLEKYTGLELEFGADRSLKITGGSSDSAAAWLLAEMIDSQTVTKVTAKNTRRQMGPETLAGFYYGESGFQSIHVRVINHLAEVDQRVAAGVLFHELGEAYSRSLSGDCGKSRSKLNPAHQELYKKHHHGLAYDFYTKVLDDLGLQLLDGGTREDEFFYKFRDKSTGEKFQIVQDTNSNYPLMQYARKRLP